MTDTHLWHPFAPMGAVRGHEFVLERGDGVWVWDEEGNRYLDATASLWYANVGHGRSEIADAVGEQMAKLEAYSTFGDFANRPALDLADRLSALTDGTMPDPRVFLVSGGGDAVDTASKLARRYWTQVGEPQRVNLLSRTFGYHGTHGFGTAIAGIEPNREGMGPLMAETARVGHDSLDDLREEVERLGPETVAAFVCEPVIGAGGVRPPVEGYLEGVFELCREHGILFVVDSVICGFGRLGTWFGYERWGLEPDMVCFAKGVTSGYMPLGGVIVSDRIAEPFWGSEGAPAFRHGATYSGHPSCCAAALANLTIIEREGLLQRTLDNEEVFHAAFRPLATHDKVGEVRGGIGLLAAVALDPEILAERPAAPIDLAARVRDHGVIVRALGDGVATSPPLIAEPEHFAETASAISAGLDAL